MALAINAARGEAEATIAGKSVRLCLTLGALAEIEAALGIAASKGLGARLRCASAHDVAVILEALLRGGGAGAEEAARVAAAATPSEAATAVTLGLEVAAQR